MLKVVKQQTTTVTQTVSLDAMSGAVMLQLSDGEGHTFRQAMDAHDVGKLLELTFIRSSKDVSLCQGDLVAKIEDSLRFIWHDENGSGRVQLDLPDEMVFEEALKSYCRMLMRSPEDLP